MNPHADNVVAVKLQLFQFVFIEYGWNAVEEDTSKFLGS